MTKELYTNLSNLECTYALFERKVKITFKLHGWRPDTIRFIRQPGLCLCPSYVLRELFKLHWRFLLSQSSCFLRHVSSVCSHPIQVKTNCQTSDFSYKSSFRPGLGIHCLFLLEVVSDNFTKWIIEYHTSRNIRPKLLQSIWNPCWLLPHGYDTADTLACFPCTPKIPMKIKLSKTGKMIKKKIISM